MEEDDINKKIGKFTDLKVWQKGHKLVLGVYKVSSKFPEIEKFGLTSQIRRAAVSLTSNIAEGFGRQSDNEKVQFYFVAKGSLIEIQNQLLIARDLKYIVQIDFEFLANLSVEISKMLYALIASIRHKQ